jgi:hypothetical protein
MSQEGVRSPSPFPERSGMVVTDQGIMAKLRCAVQIKALSEGWLQEFLEQLAQRYEMT